MQEGQEIKFHGARAKVYKIEDGWAFVELLEDVSGIDLFAEMLFKDARVKFRLPPKGHHDSEGNLWDVDW